MSGTLTLRAAYERYYVPHADHSRRTREKYDTVLKAWEKLTDNPDVRDVTNETASEFRQAMLDAGYAGSSVNGYWSSMRAIWRSLGPQALGNPFGAGLLERIPAMRPVKTRRSPPYRIPLDDLSAAYLGADVVEWPDTGIPPGDLWRALMVLAYTVGLRREDLCGLTWHGIDLDRGTLQFCAGKTNKEDVRRLHPVAVAHLRRISRPTQRVFRGLSFGGNGNFYKTFRRIQRSAGVNRVFTLHDIRRTGASEVERVRPGCGPVFLQHAARTVSDISYLNRAEELDEAVHGMRLPAAFAGTIPHVELPDVRELTAEDQIAVCELPIPNRGAWSFRPGAFRLDGRWFPLRRGLLLVTLQALAQSACPVTCDELADVLARCAGEEQMRYVRTRPNGNRITGAISELRGELRSLIGIPDTLDPIPCVQTHPSAWSLYLPNYIRDRSNP